MIDGGALVIVFLRLRLKSAPIRSSTHLAALATDKTNYFNTVETNRRRIRPNQRSLNLIPFHSAYTPRRLQLGVLRLSPRTLHVQRLPMSPKRPVVGP
jgi:hypothetical protein